MNEVKRCNRCDVARDISRFPNEVRKPGQVPRIRNICKDCVNRDLRHRRASKRRAESRKTESPDTRMTDLELQRRLRAAKAMF